MECPHCQQEIAAASCPDCGRPALPGADFCHTCGHELPPAPQEGAKLLTCSTCGKPAPEGADYCPACGKPHGEGGHQHGEEEGTCPACGEPVHSSFKFCAECGIALPPADGEEPAVQAAECPQCGARVLSSFKFCAECGANLAAPAEEAGEEGEAPAPGKRVACSDGNCIGIIGPDGKCTECGKPYQPGGED